MGTSQPTVDAAAFRARLAADPRVLDVHVLERTRAEGGADIRVCAVPRHAATEELFATLWRDWLGPGGSNDAAELVLVNRIPRLADGAVDEAALARVPVLAEDKRSELESALKEKGAARTLAHRFEPSVPREGVHLWDVLGKHAAVGTAAPSDAAKGDANASKPRSTVRALSDGGPLAFEPGTPTHLAQILQRAAKLDEAFGIHFIGAKGERRYVSYRELYVEARKAHALFLKAGVKTGDALMLQLPTRDIFLSAFWGAMLLGCTVAPLAYVENPTKSSPGAPRLLGVSEKLRGPRVVCVPKDVVGLETLGLRALAFDPSKESPSDESTLHQGNGDELALLMFTSGSTGVPKGVRLLHRNTLAISRGTAIQDDHIPSDTPLNWMSFDHAAGLVGWHVRDVLVGSRQVQVEQKYILDAPLRWLDLITEFGVTHTWAPNFAFALVNQHLENEGTRPWKLGTVRNVHNAGEPVVVATAKRFIQHLAPFGFRAIAMCPAWGMSETGSGMCCSHRFDRQEGTELVEVGPPIPGAKFRILANDGSVMNEGDIGRLEITGASLFPGYFEAPELDREVFTQDGWFRTGDFAFLKDGVLTVTGREKDVIIVRGENHFAHELEAIAEAAPGVQPASVAIVALRAPGSETDSLSVFFVPSSTSVAVSTVVRAIRANLSREAGVSPQFVVPLEASEITRSSLGKILRPELKAKLLAGAFDGRIKELDREESSNRMLPAAVYAEAFEFQKAPGSAAEGNARRWECALPTEDALGAAVVAKLSGASSASSSNRALLLCVDARSDGSEHGVSEVLRTFHRLALGEPGGVSEWVVVTRGAFGEGRATSTAAWVTGLLRVARTELDTVRIRQIDVEPGLDEARVTALLVDELRASSAEPEVLLGSEGRRVPVLTSLPLLGATAGATPVTRVVISGGLGGVGAVLARYFAGSKDAQVLLLGRSSSHGKAAQRLSTLTADFGARVQFRACDVTNPEATTNAISEMEKQWGGKADVFVHLAETLSRRALVSETPDTLARAWAAKVRGADVFLALAHERPGSRWLAFSSAMAVLGAKEHASYVAGNTYLHALARRARALGIHATTVAFSAWSHTGLSEGQPFRSGHGYLSLEPAQNVAALMLAMDAHQPVVIVGLEPEHPSVKRRLSEPSLVALQKWAVTYEAESDLTGALGAGIPLRRVPRLPDAPPTPEARWALLRDLDLQQAGGQSSRAPSDEVEKSLQRVWEEVLHVREISVEQNFFDLGGSSIQAIQVLARVREQLGVEVSNRVLFDRPTIAALAEYIRPLVAKAPAPIPSVDEMSDEQVEEMLKQLSKK